MIPGKMLQYSELSSKHGIRFSRQHLRNLENEKKFPRRVPVGERHIAWDENEIVAYLTERMAMRPS